MGIIGIVGKGDFSIFRPLEHGGGRIIGVAEGEIWPYPSVPLVVSRTTLAKKGLLMYIPILWSGTFAHKFEEYAKRNPKSPPLNTSYAEMIERLKLAGKWEEKP